MSVSRLTEVQLFFFFLFFFFLFFFFFFFFLFFFAPVFQWCFLTTRDLQMSQHVVSV